MKTFLTIITIVGAVLLTAAPSHADWDPAMPTKWVQLPDLNPLPGAITGMDVNATWRYLGVPPQPQSPFIKVLADDFPCMTTGPITGIHIWGSWLQDRVNPNTRFHLSIHDDVPADPATGMYSHPGKLLWQQDFPPGSYIPKFWAQASELFYEPNTDKIIGNDSQVWQYNFPVPPSTAFVQQGTAANPKVYWLDVQAAVPGDEVFGWKTSVDHWNDDAVFADSNLPLTFPSAVLTGPAASPVFWQDMHYPTGHPYVGKSIDQAFAITTTPEPATWTLVGIGVLGLLGYAWRKRRCAALSAVAAVSLLVPAANAAQFDYLAPGFTQQIYTGPLTGAPGMVWTSSGNLLTKDGPNILEYSLTQNTTYQGTSLHGVVVTHSIPGLFSGPTSGTGMTKGLDGFIYVPTSAGLQRFSDTLTGSATTLPYTVSGQGYGVTTMPDGKIAYVAGANTNEVYLYTPNANPSLATNTLIYTAPYSIDDIEASATGAIALAGQMVNTVGIINTSGGVINTLTGLPHHPDGLAFGDGVTANWLYSNNNDGTITQYQLGPGYSGTPVIVDIAKQTIPPNSPTYPSTGGKAYGDLAAVGPDCAFYVSQFSHPAGLNGSTIGAGTHWDNGLTTADASIVRIAAVDPRTGQEYCGFGSATETVPEPGSMLLLACGALGLFGFLSLRPKQ